ENKTRALKGTWRSRRESGTGTGVRPRPRRPGGRRRCLPRTSLGMSFERISLRSRLAFCRSTIACAVVTVGILAVSTSEARGDEGEVDFRREVLPLLSNRCFRCHGPDEGTREGGLRLDLEDAAKDPSRKSPAIVPGDPSRSEILRRIVSTDPSERMPPPEAGD